MAPGCARKRFASGFGVPGPRGRGVIGVQRGLKASLAGKGDELEVPSSDSRRRFRS